MSHAHAPTPRLRDQKTGRFVLVAGIKGYPATHTASGCARLYYGEHDGQYGKLWLTPEDQAAGKPWAVMTSLGSEVRHA